MNKKLKILTTLIICICLLSMGCSKKNDEVSVESTEEKQQNIANKQETSEKQKSEKILKQEDTRKSGEAQKTEETEEAQKSEENKEEEDSDYTGDIGEQDDTEEPEQTDVEAAVQLYEGVYRDERSLGDTSDPERDTPSVLYTLDISNVTDTSFDFCINEVDKLQENQDLIFGTNTAVFTGDGTTAVFYGKQYTLQFDFPNYHSALPTVIGIEVSGFEPTEGVTFVNNGIPGHEFN